MSDQFQISSLRFLMHRGFHGCLLIVLLLFFVPVALYADNSKGYLRFNLESVELIKKTWNGKNAKLKLYVFTESFTGEKTKLTIPGDKTTISTALYKKIPLGEKYAGLSIPITNSTINIYVIAVNESDNVLLTSAAINIISQVAKTNSIKFFKKFKKGAKTAPVASFSSHNGLYDMQGNVWEWVQDCYHSNYNGAPSNGKAWTAGCKSPAVLRGGSWSGNPFRLRSAYRLTSYRDGRGFNSGFRIARTN